MKILCIYDRNRPYRKEVVMKNLIISIFRNQPEAEQAQFAAHGDGEAAPFVPTTEDQIEQTHKSSLDSSGDGRRSQLRAETVFGYLSGYLDCRTGCVKRARVPSTNRLHQAGTQPGR